ncbi:MAG: L-arabinose isomerase, partial [Planctomycetes bacterium]|nr:L-arabinose isomerase [Planctomycetota bacterium]
LARHDLQHLKVARLGDNMRQVAVTEGDKVEAQIQLGVEVHGYGVGDLVQCIKAIGDAEVDRLVATYDDAYTMAESLREGGSKRGALRYAARTELGLRAFLADVGACAFTDTFEDLHGLDQLPGFAAQRLMADGFGFGAEGDWKMAALVRAIKTMTAGLPGGTSFMEDYTYDFGTGQVLGAHMLEVCPSITSDRPSCEVHHLGIGDKDDPVRLVFTADAGAAINVAMIDMGDRFRLLVNEVDARTPEHDLPKLPTARALWTPRPDLKTAAAAWIWAGGPHHTAFSQAATSEHIEDLADMLGLECLFIDADTRLREFRQLLR